MIHRYIALALVIGLLACGPGTQTPQLSQDWQPPMPDLGQAPPAMVKKVQSVLIQLEQLRRSDPASTADQIGNAIGELGLYYHALHFRNEARILYDKALEFQPQEARWHYYLGRLAQARYDYQAAISHFSQVLFHQPDYVAAHTILGEIYRTQNQFPQAKEHYKQALKSNSSDPEALLGLAQIDLAEQRPQAAFQAAVKVLSQQPRAAVAHYIAGSAARQLGRLKEAESHMQQRESRVSLETTEDPMMQAILDLRDAAKPFIAKGDRLQASGELTSALAAYQEATQWDAHNLELWTKLGRTALQSGDRVAALEAYRNAVRLFPGGPRLRYYLGGLLLQFQRPAESLPHLEKAIELKPDFDDAKGLLADAYRQTSRFLEALPLYAEISKNRPDDGLAYLGLALCQIQTEQHVDAVATLDRALARFPQRHDFKHLLARLLVASPQKSARNPARGAGFVDQLLKMGNDPYLKETAAMTLAAAGRYKIAIDMQNQAISMAEQSGNAALAQVLKNNLKTYQNWKPCRQPWPPDAALFKDPLYTR